MKEKYANYVHIYINGSRINGEKKTIAANKTA